MEVVKQRHWGRGCVSIEEISSTPLFCRRLAVCYRELRHQSGPACPMAASKWADRTDPHHRNQMLNHKLTLPQCKQHSINSVFVLQSIHSM